MPGHFSLGYPGDVVYLWSEGPNQVVSATPVAEAQQRVFSSRYRPRPFTKIPASCLEMTTSVSEVETTSSRLGMLFMKTQKFGGIGVVAFVLALIGVVAFAQKGPTQEKKVEHMEHSEMMQACAKACSDCQRSCDLCVTHCAHLLAEGKKDHLTTLMTCQDCATVCSAAAQIVARGGPYSVLICECCAKSCEQCATACEKFHDDKHMKACAEECRKCAKACKMMVNHMASK
jgi:hypothetical protein